MGFLERGSNSLPITGYGPNAWESAVSSPGGVQGRSIEPRLSKGFPLFSAPLVASPDAIIVNSHSHWGQEPCAPMRTPLNGVYRYYSTCCYSITIATSTVLNCRKNTVGFSLECTIDYFSKYYSN